LYLFINLVDFASAGTLSKGTLVFRQGNKIASPYIVRFEAFSLNFSSISFSPKELFTKVVEVPILCYGKAWL
jgi:hypothetical protein